MLEVLFLFQFGNDDYVKDRFTVGFVKTWVDQFVGQVGKFFLKFGSFIKLN